MQAAPTLLTLHNEKSNISTYEIATRSPNIMTHELKKEIIVLVIMNA